MNQSGETATEELKLGPEEGAEQESQEEGEEPKVRRAPKGPSKEEHEKHEATHLPFREWCKHCVRGRGQNTPHKKQKEKEEENTSKVSRVIMDYFFMSQEEEKDTGNRYMRAVGRKGLG